MQRTIPQTQPSQTISPKIIPTTQNFKQEEPVQTLSAEEEFNALMKRLDDEDKLLDLEMQSINQKKAVGFDLASNNKELTDEPIQTQEVAQEAPEQDEIPAPPQIEEQSQPSSIEELPQMETPQMQPPSFELPPTPPPMDLQSSPLPSKEDLSPNANQPLKEELPVQKEKKPGFFSKFFSKKEKVKPQIITQELSAPPLPPAVSQNTPLAVSEPITIPEPPKMPSDIIIPKEEEIPAPPSIEGGDKSFDDLFKETIGNDPPMPVSAPSIQASPLPQQNGSEQFSLPELELPELTLNPMPSQKANEPIPMVRPEASQPTPVTIETQPKEVTSPKKERVQSSRSTIGSEIDQIKTLEQDFNSEEAEFDMFKKQLDLTESKTKAANSKEAEYLGTLKRSLDSEMKERLGQIKKFETDFLEKKRALDKKINALSTIESSLEYKKKFIKEKEAELKKKENTLNDRELSLSQKEKQINTHLDKFTKKDKVHVEKEKFLMEKEKALDAAKKAFEDIRRKVKSEMDNREQKLKELHERLFVKEKDLETREKELNINTKAMDYAIKEYNNEKQDLADEEFHSYLHEKLNEVRKGVATPPRIEPAAPRPAYNKPRIYQDIETCRQALVKGDVATAKKAYNQIRNDYYNHQFAKDEEEVLHNEIRKLYDDINISMINRG